MTFDSGLSERPCIWLASKISFPAFSTRKYSNSLVCQKIYVVGDIQKD